LAAGTALILGVLVVGRYASEPAEDTTAEDRLERSERFAASAPNPEPATPAPALETMPVASAGFAAPVVEERPAEAVVKVQPKKAVTVRPAKTRLAASATTSAKSTVKSPEPIAVTPIAKVSAKRELAATNTPTVPAPGEIAGFPPVTLTGCLEATPAGDEFRLTETEGDEAPRARSWKTGFLKKRPTPVALVSPPDPHGLQRQVGRRVAVTGELLDRDMKVSSIRVVGPSCE
jgi:hypothetical protein